MRELHIDIETKCELDLTEVGVYRYASHPSFKIILFGYRYHGEDATTVIDTHNDETPGESIPVEVWNDMTDPDVLKIAQNANFEITCISIHYALPLKAKQWYCTMIASGYYGLPMNLDKIGAVLNLEHQKDKAGKALIKFFTQPVTRATKKKQKGDWNTPEEFPEKWAQFCDYNGTDVDSEYDIYDYLQRLPPLPAIEWHYWTQDQVINNRGVYIDIPFVEAAIETNREYLRQVHEEMVELTGVDNPNSLDQLKAWITEQTGEKCTSLKKEDIADALASEFLSDEVKRLYELRDAGSKTSISKYDTILKYLSDDGRIRNLLQFYGANRTGRFAGRAVQIQNLKKMLSKLFYTNKQIDDAKIVLIKTAFLKGLADILYDDVTDLISQLVRTAFVAPKGKRIISCDYSAIEARVLSWLAGEEWKLEVFKTHGKIYEAAASKMFNVPIEQVTKDSPYRAKGKVGELALGYQGWSGALIQMGALREGLTEEELPGIAKAWRKANPKIVSFWKMVENAFRMAASRKRTTVLRLPYTTLTFSYDRGYVFITLPSGRRLSYYGAHVNAKTNGLVYWGMDQTTKQWKKDDTYGGSLVENITQAVARDCLVEAIDKMFPFLDIIFHVHDEIVVEEFEDWADESLLLMQNIMSKSPKWAEGLPLAGEGYISKFYKKD